MGNSNIVYIVQSDNSIVSMQRSQVPQGETYYSTREEALQSIVNTASFPAGWMHSNKPVADYVYADSNGVVYFLYDISSAIGGEEKTYLEYVATGLTAKDYRASGGKWGPDSLGNDRYGPALAYKPPTDGTVFNYDPNGVDGELTRALSINGLNIINTPQGFNLGDYITETMGELNKNYPWLFNSVGRQLEDGIVVQEYPGLTLFLQAVSSGTEITEEQLRQSGLNAGWTSLSIKYLNATLSAMDANNPDKVIINGEEQTNRAFADLENTVSTSVDTALGTIGINASKFKKENSELYTDIVQVLMRGKYADTNQFADFLGHFLGIKEFTVAKGSAYYNDFTDLANEIKNANNYTPHVDLNTYKQSQRGKSTLINYIGLAGYNALSSDEKGRLLALFGRDEDAATAEFQRLFDNDIRFERFANKGLNYGLISGQYRQNYENIYGETPDEESAIWLDSLGLSYTDAKKAFRNDAYLKGNDKFMRDIATSLQTSLGGPVIR